MTEYSSRAYLPPLVAEDGPVQKVARQLWLVLGQDKNSAHFSEKQQLVGDSYSQYLHNLLNLVHLFEELLMGHPLETHVPE